MCESLKHTTAQKLAMHRYKHLLLGRVDLGIFQKNIEAKETEDLIAFIWGELINTQTERKALLDQRCDDGEAIDDIDFLIGLRRRKPEAASYLRGSFNAFVVDKRRRSLEIVSDRFGFRPLYYYACGNELVFASEVKAILKHDKVKKVVDPAGLADFFHFGFVTGNKTFFDGVEMFPAAGTGRFETGNLKITKYWNLAFTEALTASRTEEADHAQRLAAAIQDSVKANTQGEFRFGLPLSGGLDSRTIAACIPKDKYPIPIYTWGMPNSPEVQIARKVADTLGLRHHNLYRTPEEFVENFERAVMMTDGMIPGNLPLGNFLYAKCFAPCVDICLDGMQSISVVYPIRGSRLNGENVARQIAVGAAPETLKAVLAGGYYERFEELAGVSAKQLRDSIKALHPINGYQLLDITQKQRRLDNFGVLVKRNFVEVRSPLFDYPIIDAVQAIPSLLRKQRYIYNKAFAHLSRELAEIPNVATTVPISSPQWLQIAGRLTKGLKPRIYQLLQEKLGFEYDRHKLCDWGIDYGCWYKESSLIKTFVSRVLAKDKLKRCEHLNPGGVETIVNAQFAGNKNYTDILNRLMTYAVWSDSCL
jgi:asparagine synthase (glutamine-hydrolysing)